METSQELRAIAILGFGTSLGSQQIDFEDGTRHRVGPNQDQLSLALEAIEIALAKANSEARELDLIVSASAVAYQPIPCTAALIHEKIAKGSNIPAQDLNTTCTSFISAVDTYSYLVHAGRYQKVLIVSAEAGSKGLNPAQKESFELFSDGAAAVIIGKAEHTGQGVLAALQNTWSEGAHSTEIRGGLTRLHAFEMNEDNQSDYFFDMQGKKVLLQALRKLPPMAENFEKVSGLNLARDYDLIIPHQASKALPMMMKHLGVPEHKYVNYLREYGNLIAASVPFLLADLLAKQELKLSSVQTMGSRILLYGTAAGLSTNMLAWQL